MLVFISPDCRMATQLSWDEDMASRVLLMSSLSCVPSMDNRLYTISTCRNRNNSSNMFYSYLNTYTQIINQPAVPETLCGKRDNLPIQGSQLWPRPAHVIVWWFGHGMTSTIHLPSISHSSKVVVVVVGYKHKYMHSLFAKLPKKSPNRLTHPVS